MNRFALPPLHLADTIWSNFIHIPLDVRTVSGYISDKYGERFRVPPHFVVTLPKHYADVETELPQEINGFPVLVEIET